MRVLTIVIVICGFLAWVLATAFKSPAVGWFACAFWAAIAVGFVVRVARSRRGAAKVAVEATDEVQDMYVGRRAPTMYPLDPKENAQYGEPPRPNPLTVPEGPAHRDPR